MRDKRVSSSNSLTASINLFGEEGRGGKQPLLLSI